MQTTGHLFQEIKPLSMPKRLPLFILVSFLSVPPTFAQGAPSPPSGDRDRFRQQQGKYPAGWNNISSKGAGSTIGDL